jgi:murein DD-endopeptidase MepM/ murein hydrolase activator NlpD
MVKAAPDGGFVAEAMTKQVDRLVARSNGEIAGGSLLAAGMASGVPAGVMTEMIRIFSFDVDFQRDIQPGDRFDLMYERFHLADGRLVRGGEVMYAALTLSGKTLRLYRHKDSSGRLDYYNELGHSVRKALLKTPIDGARLTSRFGMREHPILGYSVMHRGVDFGAPTGTPIFAAGDGTIDDIGERSGYGRYIRVRHSGAYATAYAHMNGYGRGLRKGMRVRQGQVIGYVGASGRATGPHLHYEVIRDGAQINPVTVKFSTGEKLTGAELARFQATRNDLDRSLPSAQMALELSGRQEIGAGR